LQIAKDVLCLDVENFSVNEHASIKIGDIYIDPFKISDAQHDVQAVFITHSHYDHLDAESLRKVANESTVFYAPENCHAELRKHGFTNIGDKLPDYAEAFPSYNIGKDYHPKANDWVGYILTLGGKRFAICGDTDFTPELAGIKCDVLFIPIGGKYTMNATEAAKCANTIVPKVVVPTHYNSIVGTKQDEVTFLSLLDKWIEYKIFL
jgi:L-ascorbate metabolism protein UlaG (beta-lactamase superfamily)